VYTHIGQEGQAHGNLTAIYKVTEAWYERQTGQDRQSGYSLMGVSKQRPSGIFPPVDVVRACYLVGYMLYYLSRLPWRFFVPNLSVFVCMDSVRGPYQTLNKNQYIIY